MLSESVRWERESWKGLKASDKYRLHPMPARRLFVVVVAPGSAGENQYETTPRPESCELQKTDGDGFGNLNPEYYMRQGVRKRVVTRVQVRFLPFDDGRRGTEYS